MWIWLVSVLAVLAFGLFAYWALVVTEGAYLGRRVVATLYDLTPHYYDRIKEITWRRDPECLATPMLEWLGDVRRPLILDVGAGTGRFPKAMLDDEQFDGQVWGLDLSIGMLRTAVSRLESYGNRCTLIWGDADVLPFPDETFDAVVCLETLEFTPSAKRTLGELMRVLRPGGILLITNRIGRARWFPGRAVDDKALIEMLSWHPIVRIEIHSWNTFYDQVWVRKAGEASLEGRGADALETWLCDAERYSLQDGIAVPNAVRVLV